MSPDGRWNTQAHCLQGYITNRQLLIAIPISTHFICPQPNKGASIFVLNTAPTVYHSPQPRP